MIQEAIQAIVELAEPKVVEVYADANEKIFRQGDKIFPVILPSPLRANKAKCLETLIALANRFAMDDEEPKPAVWYNETTVIASLLDSVDDSRETVTFDLEHSAQFRLLTALFKNPPWYGQKEFVRLIRIDLAGSLAPGTLLDKVRVVKFENGTVTSGKIGRKEESLGRVSSASASSSEGDIPDEVTLVVPVYVNPGEDEGYAVPCAVDVDPQTCKFQLVPFSGALEHAGQMAIASIADRLRAGLNEGVPYYHGCP